ncbi:Metallo-dependent phosphatase [Pluteus cervinus]|uniref:Metallo-dependent phosphatase n=1 Tax=Pluteus cervinus TaxID=181527 RepID=A0ACD3AGW2_9AGAR|nr:Metallo-dependent phosphatase [Pluteus cervinus]
MFGRFKNIREGFAKVGPSSSPTSKKVISPPLGSTKTLSSSTMTSASTSRAVEMESEREDTPEHEGDGVETAQLRSPNERVYLHYSWTPPSTPDTLASLITIEAPPLPPKPEGWTRFVCISDTHSMTFPVPDGDVLLHSGDLTNTGTLFDFQKTTTWLMGLPHRHKIIIAGNHDLTLHTDDGWYDNNYDRWHWTKGKQDVKAIRRLLTGPEANAAGIVYLQDEDYEFQTVDGGRIWSVYGSPWSPAFFGWAFNYPREEGKELVEGFPKVDILLTHGPAFGIFDRTRGGDDAGCEDLRSRLTELRPRIHLAGHIHEARGAHIHTWDPQNNYEAPLVQYDAVMQDYAPDLEDEDLNLVLEGEDVSGDAQEEENSEGVERTVFVNAANYPAGKRANKAGRAIRFGEYGFQPVVVDLKD